MNLLPNNWTYAKINDLISNEGIFVDGDWIESKDQNPKGKVRLIQLADIGDGIFRDRSNRYLTKEKSVELGCTYLKKQDILVARLPEPLGRACIFPLNNSQNYITAVDICVIRPENKYVNIKYLLFLINSPTIRIEIDKLKSGTTRKRISRKNFAKIDLPIAPMHEQSHIAEKIEELFSDLDKATEDLIKTQEQLKIYRQAVLKAAFEGKLTEEWRKKHSISSAELLLKKIFNKRKEIYKKQQIEKQKNLKSPEKFYKKENITEIKLDSIPDTWKQIKLIDLIKYEENAIKRGPFGSAIKKAYFAPKGYKVYEQKNAINDDATLGDYYINETKYKELEGFSVKGGDFIISCSGTIGRISKLPKGASGGVINQALLKIVLEEDLFIDKLFLYLFRAEFFQRKVLKETRGSAMKNIASVEDIKNINVLLPPKEEQEQIVNEIESRLSVCDKLEETIQLSLKKIEYLHQSILKKAFEGKLVPQDPNDLPACELLKQIKIEKDKMSKNGK